MDRFWGGGGGGREWMGGLGDGKCKLEGEMIDFEGGNIGEVGRERVGF